MLRTPRFGSTESGVSVPCPLRSKFGKLRYAAASSKHSGLSAKPPGDSLCRILQGKGLREDFRLRLFRIRSIRDNEVRLELHTFGTGGIGDTV
jgi:hypothetical protein